MHTTVRGCRDRRRGRLAAVFLLVLIKRRTGYIAGVSGLIFTRPDALKVFLGHSTEVASPALRGWKRYIGTVLLDICQMADGRLILREAAVTILGLSGGLAWTRRRRQSQAHAPE